jgi:putative transposase
MDFAAGPDGRFPGSRFPAVIIGEVVWLRFRFNLSLRDIPALMAARGVVLSHQTVKDWCDTFGSAYAKEIRRRRARPGDKWHLDEMVIKINGVQQYLWRAVDQRGICLGIMVSHSRDTHTARKFLRKLLKSEQYVPRVLITDKLRSYGAAKRQVMASVEHRSHKGLNNRAENSHQRTRQRECAMRRFKTSGHAERFCSAHDLIYQHFRPPQHRLNAGAHRSTLTEQHATWNDITVGLLHAAAA